MLKQYKILVNEGKGSDNVLITVPAGAGARGNPTRIRAKPDTRYELQDDLKGKGLGPDQVRGKRVGKNLYLMFEDNGKPDIIIEGYYDPANLQQVPTIVGKAENGSIYEYIPHDPELSSMSTTLKDGTTPAMLSLGGGPIAGGAFELAGLPLVAAAAGGGLGGLGLLAAGLGAAALGGGGGGGGAAAPVAPNGGVKPTVKIAADNNPIDHYLNAAEYETVSKDTFLTVTATFDKDKVAVGDKVVFTDENNSTTTKTVVITQAMLDAVTGTKMTVSNADTFLVPTSSKPNLAVIAYLQRDSLVTPTDRDYVVLDNLPPNTDPKNPTQLVAPIIHIDNDTIKGGIAASGDISDDGDNYVNQSELNNYKGEFQVTVKFTPGNVMLGDKVTFSAKEINITTSASSDRESITRDLTSLEISQGYAVATFSAPAEGNRLDVTAKLSDAASNTGPTSNVDWAILDTTLPSAVGVKLSLAAVSDGDPPYKNNQGIAGVQTLDVNEPNEVGAFIQTLKITDKSGKEWVVSKVNGVWKTEALPVGEYIPVVTIADAHGNITKIDTLPQFYVTDLNVSDEAQSVSEVANVVTPGTVSVLVNDYDAYSKLINSTPKIPLKVVACVSDSASDTKTIADNSFDIVNGSYGSLTIYNDGTYSYKTDARAQAQTRPVDEIFTYTVQGTEGNTKTAKLTITINGVDTAAAVQILTGGNVDPNGYKNGYTGTGKATFVENSSIKITDIDTEQAYLLKPDGTHFKTGKVEYFGGFSGKYVLSQLTKDAISSSYKWTYDQDPNTTVPQSLATDPAGNVTVHDLLTLTSADGKTTQTLDSYFGVSAIDTNPYQNFYAATTTGLTAKGLGTANSNPNIIDTLLLTSAGLVLDLTAASPQTQVTQMERIDLTGSGSNTIKIDFAALTAMDSNQNQLYIIGDSGDKVQLVGTSTAWGVGNTTTHSGYTTYKYGQDELIIQNTITNITFV